MSTIGRRPALARPAAKATACDSQMPMSKKRSGNSSRTGSSLLPWHMAAVITATRGSAAICVEDRLRGDVRVRAAAACLHADDLVGLPLERRRGVEQDGVFGGRLEAVALFGHHVQQDRALGTPWTIRRYLRNRPMLWPSTGPM